MQLEAGKNNKGRTKKTQAEILKDLEETGISFTPVGLGPWSHSKLKVLKNCPLKFYLQYILKQPPQTKQEISLVTEVGKAAHRVLELTLGGKDLDRSYLQTRKEFPQLTDEQWEEHLKSVEYNMLRFKERIEIFERENGVKRIIQELRIGVTKDWEPTGFFSDDVYYRGVIDLVLQLNDGNIVVVDHKYGTVSAMGLRNFNDQLNTYKVLFDKGVEPVTGATCGIHHIKEGEVVLGDHSDAEEIRTSLLNRIEFAIEGAIDSLMEIGYFKHFAGSTCKYCDYRTECKAGDLKQMEKDSGKWFQIKPV